MWITRRNRYGRRYAGRRTHTRRTRGQIQRLVRVWTAGAVILLALAAAFLAALALEKLADKKSGKKESAFSTRRMAVTGMFSAIAMILHLLDFPLPFAP